MKAKFSEKMKEKFPVIKFISNVSKFYLGWNADVILRLDRNNNDDLVKNTPFFNFTHSKSLKIS